MCDKCEQLNNEQYRSEWFGKDGKRLKKNLPSEVKLIHFIKRSRLKHSSKYCYKELIDNINNFTLDGSKKLDIICKEHGIFQQSPQNHLKGSGCPICARLNTGIKCRKTQEEFISDCKRIHGEVYDYSLAKYTNVLTKVDIICKEHGVFSVSPHHFINSGTGCPKCGMNRAINSCRDTKESFIVKAINIHHDKYSYNDVEYINAKTKVKIKCNNCGTVHLQTPTSHLAGNNACDCYINRNLHNSFVYTLYDQFNKLYKIGISSSISRRLDNLNSTGDFNFSILSLSPILYNRSDALAIEKYLHQYFKTKQCTDFLDTDLDGKTELFYLDENDINYIDSYIKSYCKNIGIDIE